MFKKLFSLFFLWTLTIPAAYAALQANNDNLITGASLPSSINILANDTTDTGNELTISSFDSTSTSGGTVSDNSNGVLSYTPPTGFTGNDSFSYTITDSSSSSASATVAIQLKPVTQLAVTCYPLKVTSYPLAKKSYQTQKRFQSKKIIHQNKKKHLKFLKATQYENSKAARNPKKFFHPFVVGDLSPKTNQKIFVVSNLSPKKTRL
jgi:hypothetical protein